MKTKTIVHTQYIETILHNVKCQWLNNESNYFVCFVDLATSSDCYKCELTSVLAAIYSCSSSHYLTSYFKTCLTNYEKKSETGLIRLQVTSVLKITQAINSCFTMEGFM